MPTTNGVLPVVLRRLLTDTVTVARRASIDKYGQPTFDTAGAKTYRAYVQASVRLIRTSDGQEKVSSATVYVDTTDLFTPEDRLTIASSGASPVMLRVDQVGGPRESAGYAYSYTVAYT